SVRSILSRIQRDDEHARKWARPAPRPTHHGRSERFGNVRAHGCGRSEIYAHSSGCRSSSVMRRRILLVEDEPGLRRTVKDLLASGGYTVETNADGADGQAQAERDSFDLIVLDVMLPSRSGFDVARNLRKNGIQTPILMLTARTELNNKVQGLKAGADDYLTKPFEAPELLARVEALLRRSAAGGRKKLKTFEFHGIHVDFARAHLLKNGETVALSERE